MRADRKVCLRMSKAKHEPAVQKADYEELATFRYLLRRFMHFSENAVKDVGMTLHQHETLLAIQGYPGRDYVTMGELAERLQVRHNAAVGLVDRLTAEGLVERRAVDTDRRQVHVTLTQRGRELLARLAAVHRDELQHIGPQLYEQLGRLMERSSGGVASG
jgi:DNA-binding MarR family transcriptional regulator